MFPISIDDFDDLHAGSVVLVALLARANVLLVGPASLAAVAPSTGLAALLPAGLASLLRVELVSGALLVRGLSALARDLALLVVIHRREPALLGVVCHARLLHTQLRSPMGGASNHS